MTTPARIVALSGGIGGAKFLSGLVTAFSDSQITVIGNVGDDITLYGLRICPDLDSIMYTLAGAADPGRGWGLAEESWRVRQELAAYGPEPWFGLGDRDLATHLARTGMLQDGEPLSQVTSRLAARWKLPVQLLPATDDRVETHVRVNSSSEPIHFQKWWVGGHAEQPAQGFVYHGCEGSRPAPGVLDAIASADVIVLTPSNPVVSIAPILAIPGIREAVEHASVPVTAVSPIIGGAPVRGMADKCLAALGVECSAAGVASFYGPELIDCWLVAPQDAADFAAANPQMSVHGVPLLMSDREATCALARAAVTLAGAW